MAKWKTASPYEGTAAPRRFGARGAATSTPCPTSTTTPAARCSRRRSGGRWRGSPKWHGRSTGATGRLGSGLEGREGMAAPTGHRHTMRGPCVYETEARCASSYWRRRSYWYARRTAKNPIRITPRQRQTPVTSCWPRSDPGCPGRRSRSRIMPLVCCAWP